MTGQPSVTGSDGEVRFGPWLAEQLRADPALRGAEIWTIPVGEGDSRACAAMLVRGAGPRTLILTGHYDTVSTDDYGALGDLATRPEALKQTLRARLEERAETPAEKRARDDLATDDFLPGRGLLDMKAGLAAGLAVAEAFAGSAERQGNLLFIAVPDEERSSAGARRAAQALPAIAARHGLDLAGAINLDAMADDGDGSAGRIVALGTVGKLLPTAFVVGIPTHGCYPFAGVNAAAIAAAIAARIEWAPELTDDTGEEPGTPPSLLGIRDGKPAYDVTTPATAFASWNVLMHTRPPADMLDAFDRLCAEAAADCLAAMHARAAISHAPADRAPADRAPADRALADRAPGGLEAPAPVPVVRYEAVAAAARRREPRLDAELAPFRRELAASGLALPERCRLMTERVWAASGLPGPAIVTGFGSTPYLPVALSDRPSARRLGRAARGAAAEAESRYGTADRLHQALPGDLGCQLPRRGGRGIAGGRHGEHAHRRRERPLARAGQRRRCADDQHRAMGARLSHAARAAACRLCLRRAATPAARHRHRRPPAGPCIAAIRAAPPQQAAAPPLRTNSSGLPGARNRTAPRAWPDDWPSSAASRRPLANRGFGRGLQTGA